MIKLVGSVCALGCLFLFVAGCEPHSPFLVKGFFAGHGDGDVVLAGSVERVAASLHGDLSRLGVSAYATPEAEGLRLVGSTAGGKRFVVVLKRDGKGDQERTRVRIDWEDGRDEGAQVKINALFEALKAK